MIQDGTGYGRSHYWEWKAKEIALEHDEACKHFFGNFPIVKIKYETPKNGIDGLKLRVKCKSCDTKFPNTEEFLKKKFLEFYGK